MLHAKHLAHQEIVGKMSNGDEVVHLVSKGGRHYMAKRNQFGVIHPDPIGVGPHRAIAKHMADLKTSNGITWNEKLYKSYNEEENLKKSELDSTPEKHLALADHHAKLANKYAHIKANPEVHAKDVNDYYKSFNPKHQDMTPFQLAHDVSMHHLIHKDVALKHYQMAGLSHEHAISRLAQHVDPNMSLQTKEPHNESELALAWGRKNPHASRPGSKVDWTK